MYCTGALSSFDNAPVILLMKYLLLLIILLGGVPPTYAAKKQYGDIIVKDVVSIYDADTFRVNIKGYPAVIGERMSIRVLGVDAPEIRGKCPKEKKLARLAKQFTVKHLRAAKVITLHGVMRGKYFRLLAYVDMDGEDLSTLLIRSGHARPYDGGKRRGWCEN